MTESHQDTPKALSPATAFSLIEKAQELRWTLQLAAIVLFADIGLAWKPEGGILQWSLSLDHLLSQAGIILVGILAFCLVMSVVMPVASAIVRTVLGSIPWIWLNSRSDGQRPYGMVRPYELHNHALESGDKLLYDIYAELQRKEDAQHVSDTASGLLAFSVLALGAANLFLGYWWLPRTTLLQALISATGSAGIVGLTLFAIFLLFAIWVSWFSLPKNQWIACMPLYRKITAEQERRREGNWPFQH